MESQKTTGRSGKAFGPLVGIGLIAILLISGAVYFWGEKSAPKAVPVASQEASTAAVSPSDEVSSIDADLQATDTGPDLSGMNDI